MDEIKDETTSVQLPSGGGVAWTASDEGAGIPNPLILGRLFRLVTDRCDDLRFPRLHSLDGCGRLVLFGCYLASEEQCPSDHGYVASSGDLRATLSRDIGQARRVSASSLCSSADGGG